MPPRLPDDKRAAILDDIRVGKPRNHIAREHEVSPSTVTKLGNENGLTFDRTQTLAATRAKQADNQARRAELASLLLDDAHRLRAQLWEPCTIGAFGGRENVWAETDLNEPTFSDKRAILASVHSAVRDHIDLERVDSDGGADSAKGMLGALAAGLQAAYDQLPPDDQS